MKRFGNSLRFVKGFDGGSAWGEEHSYMSASAVNKMQGRLVELRKLKNAFWHNSS